MATATQSGKSLAAYANTIPKEAKDDYKALKVALLQGLGLTTEQCRLDFWTLTKQYGETWQKTARTIDSTVSRMIKGCKSVEEVSIMLSIHKNVFLYVLQRLSITYRSGSQNHPLKLLTWCRITSEDIAETDITSRGSSMDKAVMATVRRSGNDRTVLMD